MTLKKAVAISLGVFAAFVLYFWATGIWFAGPPPTPEEQQAGAIKAAKEGLFDEGAPPIINTEPSEEE